MTKLQKTLDKIREVSGLRKNFCDCNMPVCIHLGEPVHLEHLFYAVQDSSDVWVGFELRGVLLNLLEDIDLTQSVEQNLESNEELLNLVAELLGVE